MGKHGVIPAILSAVLLLTTESGYGKVFSAAPDQHLSTLTVNPRVLDDTHDVVSLPDWGPYTKRYAGISHIPAMERGIRYDFSVFPGYYRGKLLVPNVLVESSYMPWDFAPSLKRFTYRYQLEWKDRVYVDVTYHTLDSARILVEARCVNGTGITQNIALHGMSWLDYPDLVPRQKLHGADKLRWHDAVDYLEMEPARRDTRYGLVTDGMMRGEQADAGALDGHLLGRGFGRDSGDRVAYSLAGCPEGTDRIRFRFRMKQGEKTAFRLEGAASDRIVLTGTGDFAWAEVSPDALGKGNRLVLMSEGGAPVELDGFLAGRTEDFAGIELLPNDPGRVPQIDRKAARNAVVLKYPDAEPYYGVGWDFEPYEVREVYQGQLDVYFRERVHDHVQSVFRGDGQGHYTDVFMRPVVVAPGSERTVRMLLCHGSRDEVRSALGVFAENPEGAVAGIVQEPEPEVLPAGEPYRQGRQILQAAVLSNIVYPIYTQRQYIRHFTPGHRWNSLYTWDSGFIALGLLEIDPRKSFECVNAYTTPEGAQSAFIHHGSPVPVQFYAFQELWNRTQDRAMLEYLYPRLRRYYEFLAGNHPDSPTKMPSGLIRTWDYFYNSGGWDDYPPQQAMHSRSGLSRTVTPVISTAQCIRAAKILRQAARMMGMKKDAAEYDRDIARMAGALQSHAWDAEEGYFSYVEHDGEGIPQGFFRHPGSGVNYNRGLDGVSPLVSGICTPEQNDRMIGHLFSEKEMWTPCGISTVDRSAPYYREDGYWNGTVWMPHQWFMWKAMLDLGEGEKAFRIARTALEVWERETSQTYYTFEHFIISSGRGGGWHHFSGLSSPVLNWFAAYYTPGHVATGNEVWILRQAFAPGNTGYEATLGFDDSSGAHDRTVIVTLDPNHRYKAWFQEREIPLTARHAGLAEVTLPAVAKEGVLRIFPE